MNNYIELLNMLLNERIVKPLREAWFLVMLGDLESVTKSRPKAQSKGLKTQNHEDIRFNVMIRMPTGLIGTHWIIGCIQVVCVSAHSHSSMITHEPLHTSATRVHREAVMLIITV